MRSPPQFDDSYESTSFEQEVTSFRALRHAKLTADDGWLTVVGKVWLGAGVHAVGVRSGCPVELPPGSPELAGHVGIVGRTVTFEPTPGVRACVAGVERTGRIELGSQDVQFGTITLQLVRRGDDVAIRVRDSDSPARRAFKGVPAYPTDSSWRLWATLRRHASEQRVTVEDGDGRLQEYVSPGVAVFTRGSTTVELEPVYDSDRRRLFLLFRDGTNRDETYGAGRFLYTPLPQGDRVLLDFNQAFNPPCSFTPYVSCPLPPLNNRTTLRIEAGEKRPNIY